MIFTSFLKKEESIPYNDYHVSHATYIYIHIYVCGAFLFFFFFIFFVLYRFFSFKFQVPTFAFCLYFTVFYMVCYSCITQFL